jgi:hypothetical protein
MMTMLRISPKETRGAMALKLEGKLGGPWVDELQAFWLGHSRQKGQMPIKSVDLAEVSFIDDRGTELLRRMRRKGVSLVGGSDFINQLLTDGMAGRARTGKSRTIK